MSENLKQGGSYVIDPETQEVQKKESTALPEAIKNAEPEKQLGAKKKTNQGDK